MLCHEWFLLKVGVTFAIFDESKWQSRIGDTDESFSALREM